MTTIFVPGHAKPKGSWTPFHTKSGSMKLRPASNATARWCRWAKEYLTLNWSEPVMTGPVAVSLLFALPRAKTVIRDFPYGRYEGDIDKLLRGLLDAMTGIVYVDDAQVVGVFNMWKVYREPIGVTVEVTDAQRERIWTPIPW